MVSSSSFSRSQTGSGAGELYLDDGIYLERRRWSVDEKWAILTEAKPLDPESLRSTPDG
jgi:hypothetical protein